jgi:predicted nucleic acid-binding Zn ribbon protein
MQHIKELLSKRLKQTGLSKNIRTSLVIEEFDSLLRKDFSASVATKIKPLYVKNKILTVACLSSVIASELNLHKQQLISQINKKFKSIALRDIRFIL